LIAQIELSFEFAVMFAGIISPIISLLDKVQVTHNYCQSVKEIVQQLSNLKAHYSDEMITLRIQWL